MCIALMWPRFPLASVAGALQRRITARYDDLARASQAQCLTIDQVRACVRASPSHANTLRHPWLPRALLALVCGASETCSDLTGVALLEIEGFLWCRTKLREQTAAFSTYNWCLLLLQAGSTRVNASVRKVQNGLIAR